MGKNKLAELDVLLMEAHQALNSALVCADRSDKEVWERVALSIVKEGLEEIKQEWSRRNVRRARSDRRMANLAPHTEIVFPEA